MSVLGSLRNRRLECLSRISEEKGVKKIVVRSLWKPLIIKFKDRVDYKERYVDIISIRNSWFCHFSV